MRVNSAGGILPQLITITSKSTVTGAGPGGILRGSAILTGYTRGVGVGVLVGVGVFVGVFVIVGVLLGISVFVGVYVCSGINVGVLVGVSVGVGVFVGVTVSVALGPAGGVGVGGLGVHPSRKQESDGSEARKIPPPLSPAASAMMSGLMPPKATGVHIP